MKKYFIAFALLLVGLYGGFVTFNHIDAWVGIFVTIAVIGFFLNFIYKQIEPHLTAQLKNNDNEKV